MSGTANSSDLPPWVEVFCKHTDCRAYRNPLSHELYKLLKIIKILCGGERGIRTHAPLEESASYRLFVARSATVAVAHDPKLGKSLGAAWSEIGTQDPAKGRTGPSGPDSRWRAYLVGGCNSD